MLAVEAELLPVIWTGVVLVGLTAIVVLIDKLLSIAGHWRELTGKGDIEDIRVRRSKPSSDDFKEKFAVLSVNVEHNAARQAKMELEHDKLELKIEGFMDRIVETLNQINTFLAVKANWQGPTKRDSHSPLHVVEAK